MVALAPGQQRKCLGLGHRRRPGLRPGQDHGLGQLGRGQLPAENGGGGGIGRHPWSDIPGDAGLVESPGLLGQRRVDRRIARAEPGNVPAPDVGIDQVAGDLVEIQLLGIDELGAVGTVRENLGMMYVPAYRQTGEVRIRDTARRVSRSAAPGPAPMK